MHTPPPKNYYKYSPKNIFEHPTDFRGLKMTLNKKFSTGSKHYVIVTTNMDRNLHSFIVGYRGDFFGETQKTKAGI